MAISQDQLNFAIGNIEILHGRFGNELCDILKRHSGDRLMYDELVNHNNTIAMIMDILYRYDAYGNTELNESYNNLTEAEIQSLISYSYRILNKYGHEIFIPTNPNIYL